MWAPVLRNLLVWAAGAVVFPDVGGFCTLTSPGPGVRRPHLEIGGLQTPRPGVHGGLPGDNLQVWAPRPVHSSPSERAPKTDRPPTRHFVCLKDIKISIGQIWAPTSGDRPRLAKANSGCGRQHRQVWAKGVLVSPGLGGRERQHFRVWARSLRNLRFWAPASTGLGGGPVESPGLGDEPVQSPDMGAGIAGSGRRARSIGRLRRQRRRMWACAVTIWAVSISQALGAHFWRRRSNVMVLVDSFITSRHW